VAPTIAMAAVSMSQSEIQATKIGGEPYDDEKIYFGIIEGKTARLFSAACRSGALIAGAPDAAVDALAEFGLQWGMSFQITDDALDLVGDRASLGKPIGSDIDTGKVTLPLIEALRRASDGDRQRLRALVRQPAGEGIRHELRALVDRYDGIHHALDMARAFAERATAALDALHASRAKASLQDLAAFVVVRAR
jgi:octaprenyl-diphosphate synthase